MEEAICRSATVTSGTVEIIIFCIIRILMIMEMMVMMMFITSATVTSGTVEIIFLHYLDCDDNGNDGDDDGNGEDDDDDVQYRWGAVQQ